MGVHGLHFHDDFSTTTEPRVVLFPLTDRLFETVSVSPPTNTSQTMFGFDAVSTTQIPTSPSVEYYKRRLAAIKYKRAQKSNNIECHLDMYNETQQFIALEHPLLTPTASKKHHPVKFWDESEFCRSEETSHKASSMGEASHENDRTKEEIDIQCSTDYEDLDEDSSDRMDYEVCSSARNDQGGYGVRANSSEECQEHANGLPRKKIGNDLGNCVITYEYSQELRREAADPSDKAVCVGGNTIEDEPTRDAMRFGHNGSLETILDIIVCKRSGKRSSVEGSKIMESGSVSSTDLRTDSDPLHETHYGENSTSIMGHDSNRGCQSLVAKESYLGQQHRLWYERDDGCAPPRGGLDDQIMHMVFFTHE